MKKNYRSLICMVLVVLSVFLSFYMFTDKIGVLTYENVKNRLIETTENSAKAVKQLVDQDANQLKGIAAQLVDQKMSDTQKKEILVSATTYTRFLKLRLYDTQGKGYQTNGNEVLQYQEEQLTDVATAGPLLQLLDHGQYIGVSMPFFNELNEVVGRIEGVYMSQYMADSLDKQVFDGQGYYDVIEADGDLLWRTDNVQQLYEGSNAFEILQDAKFEQGYDLNQLKQAMQTQQKVFVMYELNGEGRCAYYMPAEIGDWYLMAVVPSTYLLAQKAAIENNAVLLTVMTFFAFFVMFAILILNNRKAGKRVERERDYLERVINTVPAPIFIVNNKRTIITVNKAACELFHSNAQELIGRPCCSIRTNICNTPNCAIEKMVQSGIGVTFFDVNGRQFMVSTTFMNDMREEKIGFVEVMQDISDLMNVQKILEEKTLELETISHNLAVGLLITTLEEGFPIIRCNERYLELIGCHEKEVLGTQAIRWVMSDDAQHTESTIHEQLEAMGSVSLEHRMERKDGSQIWISLYGKQTLLHHEKVGVWILLDISDQRKTEEQLKINEERYRIAAQNTEDIIVDFDMNTRRMIHTPKIKEIYGLAEIVEHAPESLIEANIIDEQTVPAFLDLFARVTKGEPKASCDILAKAKDGRKIWSHFTFITIFDSDGKPTRAIGIMHDFTQEKVTQLKYQREAQFRKMAMEDASLYYEVNLTKRIFVSGYEELVKNYVKHTTNDFDTVVELLLNHVVYTQDRELVSTQINWKYLMDAYLAGKQKVEFEYRRIIDRDEFGWVMCTLYLMQDEDTKDIICLGYIKDIDESKKLELSLKHQAESDLLTGLYNKITTESIIEQELKKHHGSYRTLMIIDLDDFKSINDSLGHAFGDAVLSEVSQELKFLFLERGILGRVGGDEFIVFLNDVRDDEEAEQHAKDICDIFHHTYTGEKNHYKVSGTVGIACAPRDGTTFKQLYRNADIALYYAKNNGKDTYCRYQRSLPQIGSDQIIRSIDKNAGKSFSDHIVEYVLRILYDSPQPALTLHAVLELVSKHYNFSRSYLFMKTEDGSYWKDAYEWCHDQVLPRQQQLQQVSIQALLPYFHKFDEDGMLIVHDIEEIEPVYRQHFLPEDICSMIQFKIMKDGEQVAILGFDDCILHRSFEEQEIETLHMVMMLIDAFLVKHSSS